MKTIVELMFCVIYLGEELEIETFEFKSIVIGNDLFLDDCINDAKEEIEEEVIILLKNKELKLNTLYRMVIETELKSVVSFDGEIEEWDTEIICEEKFFCECYPLPPIDIKPVEVDFFNK